MNPSRRDFLKLTTIGGAAAAVFGFDLKPAYAQLRTLKIARASETRSTCPYCSVSCGVIIYTIGDRAKNVTPQVVHVEGDPDHPINRGTLCPKGASLQQDILNERRLVKPQVRRLDGYQRIQLSGRQDHAQPGGRTLRKPGQSLTRPHGLKFGTNVRPGRNDQWLDRHQEYRHDAHHGR